MSNVSLIDFLNHYCLVCLMNIIDKEVEIELNNAYCLNSESYKAVYLYNNSNIVIF